MVHGLENCPARFADNQPIDDNTVFVKSVFVGHGVFGFQCTTGEG